MWVILLTLVNQIHSFCIRVAPWLFHLQGVFAITLILLQAIYLNRFDDMMGDDIIVTTTEIYL